MKRQVSLKGKVCSLFLLCIWLQKSEQNGHMVKIVCSDNTHLKFIPSDSALK